MRAICVWLSLRHFKHQRQRHTEHFGNYGAIGTIGRDAQVTFAVPVAAVQGLANGTYGGLCLYESPYNFGSSTYSSCYMRMSGTDSDLKPYLQVVYS